MKRSLLVLINLLSFTSPSVAMLDKELERVTGSLLAQTYYRQISPEAPLYKGRSQLCRADYPKVPLVFPYRTNNIHVPFSASIPENQAHAHAAFQNFLSHEFSNYQKVYSFVIQDMSKQDDHQYHALKPHCFVHPQAPYEADGNDLHSHLQWMVVRGDEGNVNPLKGDFSHGLHKDGISTHAVWSDLEAKMVMGISGDVMHLTGINHNKSVGMHSFVAFEDTYHQNKKIVAITYHWLLNEEDISTVWDELPKTTTFRELITNLEPVDGFKKLVPELKRYIGFSPKEKPLPVPLPPAMQKPVPQKQVSPPPSQKPALKQESVPRENIKTTPVNIITKVAPPAKKVIPTRAPSVTQKPVAKPNAKPLPVPLPPAVQKPVPQKQVSPPPSQKPALKQESVPRENIKTTPVNIITKVAPPAKKVIPTRAPSVTQKPVAKPNAKPLPVPLPPAVQKPVPQKQVSPPPSQKPALKQESVPRENIKTTPVNIITKVAPPAKKVIPTRAPSVTQKPVAKPKALPNRAVKTTPVKTNIKLAQVRAKAKAAPIPTKAKMLVRKVIKSAPVKTKVNPALVRGNPKVAPGTKAAFLTNGKKIQQRYNGKNVGLRADQKRVR